MSIPANKLTDVAFSTDFNYERVFMKGRVQVPLGSTRTITHNLGYAPFYRIWTEFGNGQFYEGGASPYMELSVYHSSDANTITLEAYVNFLGSFGQVVNFYYRIYEERTS